MKSAILGLAAVMAMTLAGCRQEAALIETPMGTLTLQGHQTAQAYAYAEAGANEEVFVLYLGGDDTVTWDQTRLYSYFCEDKPAKIAPENGMPVSAGGVSMEKSAKSGQYRCAILFEVPLTEAKVWTVFWPDGTQTDIRK